MLRVAVTLVFFLYILMSDARTPAFDTAGLKEYEQWKQETGEFFGWKKWKQPREYNVKNGFNNNNRKAHINLDYYKVKVSPPPPPPPPPVDEAALMARYIVNQADWASIATISTRKDIETFPTASLVSLSDGPLGNGSGIPYMYLTPLDSIAKDISKDHRASLLMTLAQGKYCENNDLDPMDPRCARITLTGKIIALKDTNKEHEIAKRAVFNRHPKLKNLPSDHHFFFAKLKISAVVLLDTFGGFKYIDLKDYFHPPTMNDYVNFIEVIVS